MNHPKMIKSPTFLILFSLSLLSTLALNPTLRGNYFYVPADNHLSYELFQTRNGTIAHSIEPLNETHYTSRYALINLDTKDALAILADLVDFCDIPNPTFQSLHYHAQTDSLVYYCAKNTSLLILNQQDHTVQGTIPLSLQASLPVAKLSTDGATSVAILLMDTLFTQSPQNSVLLKVDLQTKTVSTQVLFNQGLASKEAVVAYAANKNYAYIATNLIQGTTLTTTVYSIILTGNNTYQLPQVIVTLNSSATPNKIITKLFTLEGYVIVNSGTYIHFFDQQGFVQETQIRTKPLNSETDGLYLPTVTAQDDGANLYAVKNIRFAGISVYSVVNNSVQRQDIQTTILDFHLAFGNPGTPGSDLIFVSSDPMSLFFFILETKTFQTIYQAISGYADLMLTDATYTVVRPLHGLDSFLEAYIFDLKTDAFLKRVSMNAKHYFNKDQKIISYLRSNASSGCYLGHVDIVSGKDWTTTTFPKTDPICSSYVVNARITEKGNPEAVFAFADHYEILSETYGRQTFPTTSDTDSINVNFGKDLTLYYLSANQTTNQITASLYAFNPLTKNFARISTNTLNNQPVEDQGFFIQNQTTTFALSSTSFAVISKLNSVWSQGSFQNSYNMLTTFTDNTDTQFTFFGYSNSTLAKGLTPKLFSSHFEGFVPIPGERLSTVNARATGLNSFALQDDLHSVGVVRFYNADLKTEKRMISV